LIQLARPGFAPGARRTRAGAGAICWRTTATSSLGVADIYLSTSANRLNIVMKQLSVSPRSSCREFHGRLLRAELRVARPQHRRRHRIRRPRHLHGGVSVGLTVVLFKKRDWL
jgi:hypothetical protein